MLGGPTAYCLTWPRLLFGSKPLPSLTWRGCWMTEGETLLREMERWKYSEGIVLS